MDEADIINRSRSASNHSSINTPKLRKRLSDFRKDSLVFSQILKKQKVPMSENNSIMYEMQKEDNKQATQRTRKGNHHNIVIKKTRDHLDPQERTKSLTPCSDLHKLFTSHKIAQQYIAETQKHKFEHLVIVGVILPYEMMRKLTKLIDFYQQYKLSSPQNIFSTDFNQLLGHKTSQSEQVSYVFWTYEVGDGLIGQSVKNSVNNIAYSTRFNPMVSTKSIKEGRMRKLTHVEQYSVNLKSLILEVPQIVITTKKFIKENTELFFPQLLSDIPNPSSHDQPRISLQPELDIEKFLLYIDEDEINKSQNSSSTPRYMGTSSRLVKQMKMKNPEMKSSSYIELEPDEEYFNEDERDKNMLLEKGELDKLMTARSNEQLTTEKEDTGRDENLELFELLEKESIFKHVSYLQPFLFQNESTLTNYSKERQQNNTKKGQQSANNPPKEKARKNSLNSKNIERQRQQRFKQFLNEQIKLSLKKNYNYSRFCSSWVFFHFLTNFYQHNVHPHVSELRNIQDYNFGSRENNDNGIDAFSSNHSNNAYLNSSSPYTGTGNSAYSALMIKSLKTFKKQIELRFFQKLENDYKEVLDEPTLRNILRAIKMQELIFMKKNLSSILLPPKSIPLQNKNLSYSETQLSKEYLTEIQHEIVQFMDRLEDQIYFENNKHAMTLNYKVLQNEYEQIIQGGFRKQKLRKKDSIESSSSLNSEQRPLSMLDSQKKKLYHQSITAQLQRDFNQFMQAYTLKGIKVSSQMKTFSDFMQKRKQSYLKNVYLLTKEKKNYQKEQEEKQNKQRKIKLLQMEIFKIQDKKKQIKDKNQLIKRQIKSIQKKAVYSQKLQRQDSINKKSNQKGRSARGGKSVVLSGSDNFEFGSRDKNKSIVEIGESGQKQSRLKKSASFAFEIENSKNKSYISQSAQKDRNRQTFNRYSKKKSMEEGDRFYNYNRQTIEEEETKRMKIKRCMTCCEVM